MKINQLNLQSKNKVYGEIISNSDFITMTRIRKIHYGYNNNTSLLIDLIEVELRSQIQ